MNKKIYIYLITLFCILSCSCGKETPTADIETATSTEETNVIEESSETTEETAKENAEPINIGDTIDLSYINLTLDAFEVAERYDFSYTKKTTVGTSTKNAHIEPSGGMKLITLTGTIKNKSNQSVYASNNVIHGKLIVNGNEYNTRLDCYNTEEAESIFELVPQQSTTYFLYSEVPIEVADNINDICLYFGFINDFGNKYTASLTDLDSLYVLNTIPTVKK